MLHLQPIGTTHFAVGVMVMLLFIVNVSMHWEDEISTNSLIVTYSL